MNYFYLNFQVGYCTRTINMDGGDPEIILTDMLRIPVIRCADSLYYKDGWQPSDVPASSCETGFSQTTTRYPLAGLDGANGLNAINMDIDWSEITFPYFGNAANFPAATFTNFEYVPQLPSGSAAGTYHLALKPENGTAWLSTFFDTVPGQNYTNVSGGQSWHLIPYVSGGANSAIVPFLKQHIMCSFALLIPNNKWVDGAIQLTDGDAWAWLDVSSYLPPAAPPSLTYSWYDMTLYNRASALQFNTDFFTWLNTGTAPVPPPTPDDPYEDLTPAAAGGGGGTFDYTSDVVPRATPPYTPVGNRFASIYFGDFSAFKAFLWSDLTTFLSQGKAEMVRTVIGSLSECIISYGKFPFTIPTESVYVRQNTDVDLCGLATGITLWESGLETWEVDCGSVTLDRYTGSAFDNNPYVTVDLYLPFIGAVSLNADEVMGHTIHIWYYLHLLTGTCSAQVMIDTPGGAETVMYEYSGSCMLQLPISESNYQRSALNRAVSAVGTVATTVGTVMATFAAGPAAGAAVGSAGALPAAGALSTELAGTQAALTGQTAGDMLKRAGNVLSSIADNGGALLPKSPYATRAAFRTEDGWFLSRVPYLTITAPSLSNPEDSSALYGLPSNITTVLGSVTGYVRVRDAHLDGIPCTGSELDEIKALLMEGVIL